MHAARHKHGTPVTQARASFHTLPLSLCATMHNGRPPQKSAVQKPSHWPSDVPYITQQQYHASVPKQVLAQLVADQAKTSSATHAQRPAIAIREITESAHPARGQRGLFAAKKIPPRTHIIDYVGEVHCDERPHSDYDLSLYRGSDGLSVGVDASKMGNEARFINDYRGVRPKPNALFEERRTERGELCMSVWSGSEGIKKGEELLVSYGKSFWRARTSDSEDSDAG